MLSGQAISVILLNLLILGVKFAIILRRVNSLQLVVKTVRKNRTLSWFYTKASKTIMKIFTRIHKAVKFKSIYSQYVLVVFT